MLKVIELSPDMADKLRFYPTQKNMEACAEALLREPALTHQVHLGGRIEGVAKVLGILVLVNPETFLVRPFSRSIPVRHVPVGGALPEGWNISMGVGVVMVMEDAGESLRQLVDAVTPATPDGKPAFSRLNTLDLEDWQGERRIDRILVRACKPCFSSVCCDCLSGPHQRRWPHAACGWRTSADLWQTP